MATVYLGRARSPEGGDEVVALKVIKDEHSAKEEYIQMFLDEARILARLSHPNVIATVDSGIDEELRFIAMELLLGRSLADTWNTTLDGTPFPRELAAWIVARTADGLQYAHDATDAKGEPLKVIHRDVNPTNIFLTYDGQVKLIDFGLAKVVGRKSKSAQGVVKGKIPYLAPEQVAGLDVDGRVDVYGLGITLWEITTGRRLFKRSTDVATLQAIQKAEVPDARDLVPGYPDELWKIVSGMLEPDRDKRTRTARDVAKALDAFLGTREDALRGREVAAFLDARFPGEQDRQTDWLREATNPARAITNATVPPPAPVPALLDSAERPTPMNQRTVPSESERARAVTVVSATADVSEVPTVRIEDEKTVPIKRRASEGPKSTRGPKSKRGAKPVAKHASAKKTKAAGDAQRAEASDAASERTRAGALGMWALAFAAAMVVLYALVHH